MANPHTIVLGDTHMNWSMLLRAIYHFRPQVCIVAGDFGWWPSTWLSKNDSISYLLESKPLNTEIRFIEGNHEDLPHLFTTVKALTHAQGLSPFDPVELHKGLWYQPRGSTYTLADGRTILFCGGGKSVDAPLRRSGIDWFPEEIVRREELPDVLPKADIVISHTVPNRLEVLQTLRPINPHMCTWDMTDDPTCTVLDWVFDTVHPDLWIASHLHVFRRGKVDSTEYIVLNRTDDSSIPYDDFSYILTK